MRPRQPRDPVESPAVEPGPGGADRPAWQQRTPAPQHASSPPAPDVGSAWYLSVAGQPQGPLGTAGLHRAVEDRTLVPETLVWRADMAAWAVAETVPEIAALLVGTPDAGAGPSGREPNGDVPGGRPGHPDVVPFTLTDDDAQDALRAWLGTRPLRPGGLAEVPGADRVRSAYVPVWSFDAMTVTTWFGVRRDQEMIQREQKSWRTQKRGTTQTHVKNAVVLATRQTDASRRLLSGMRRVLDTAVPSRPGLLAGHDVLEQDLGADEAWPAAQKAMWPTIRSAIEADIGGDSQSIVDRTTTYTRVARRLLLMPVWFAVYTFAGRQYAVTIHGAEGTVTGQHPTSPAKLALAWTIALVVVGLFVALLVWMSVSTLNGEPAPP